MTENRLKHSCAVAKKMKELVIEQNEIFSISPDEAFILGMLHDIGYEFTDQQQEHAHIGGNILKAQGYKYWKEVFFHGISQKEYDSLMLKLLNYVDMITGPDGTYMSIQKRIQDIIKRYGSNSKQAKEAIKLTKDLEPFLSEISQQKRITIK